MTETGLEIIEIEKLMQVAEPNRNGIVHPSKAIRMLNRIVLDITYQCSLKCPNCNRFCGIFPRTHETSLSIIRDFVDHSVRSGKRWHHIYIAGGEPSMHSRIKEVIVEIARYVEFHKAAFKSNLIVKYFTNNHAPKAGQVLRLLPDFIVVSSDKKDSAVRFKPICVAPIDLDFYDDQNLSPCQELYQCGMALNYKGYYPCAEAAAIDDVYLKRNLGIRNLEDATFENLSAILHQTCRVCGHYFEPIGYRRDSRLMVSSTWRRYLEKENILPAACRSR
jgi:hypothetical protein